MAKKVATKGASVLKAYCRSLAGTTEDVKWGDDLVFSVGKKMYAAFDLDDEDEFGVKCDDEDFDRLLEIDGIIPAPYAARFGWVKVQRRGVLKLGEAKGLIHKSYDLVFERLTKRAQREIRGGV